jgi:predicted XRE-type DNA-binding protein
MYIEKNVFENIFNTIMDVKEKTKDNINARMNISLFCHCKNMELIYDELWVAKSKVSFILRKKIHSYLSTNVLRVYVFLMNKLQTYQC